MSDTWRRVFGFPVAATEASQSEDHAERDDQTRQDVASRSERRTLGSIELHDEPTRERWMRRTLRTLFVVALVVMVLVGLRSILRPTPRAAPTAIPAAVTYDRGSAAAVAVRWASAYLSLAPGDANQNSRTAALALDAAAGVDTSGGAIVKEAQVVKTALPGGVAVATDGRTSVVTVLAQVAIGTAPARWVAVAVPIGTDGTRPVVTAAGAFVAFPSPGQSKAGPSLGDEDSTVTAQTRNTVSAWLAAYGAADTNALDGISAPGSTAAPIGGLTFTSLDAWHVATGDDHTRSATAAVTWTTAAGTVRQSYALTLSAVRSGDTTDWRVLSATATATR